MDVFICTGERSGDHLAAELCRQIRARGPGRYDIAGMTGPVDTSRTNAAPRFGSGSESYGE